MPQHHRRRGFFKEHPAAVSISANQPLPLSELASGEQATFVELCSGRRLSGRLTSLGFTPGVLIAMVQNYGWGPLIVEVRGTRVALGRREAKHILVQRSQP